MIIFTTFRLRSGAKVPYLQGAFSFLWIALLGFLGAWWTIGNEYGHAQDGWPRALSAIDIAGFRSGAHHWRRIRDEKRFILATSNQASYTPANVRGIAGNILLFQRENGGWPKDYDMLAILNDEQRKIVASTRDRADSSFDNDNIHSQVKYLAHAYVQGQEPAWREACTRGLDFILRAQYANGGFPQHFPDAEGYHSHITFNDGVMIGNLNILQDAAEAAPHFAWLDERRRQRALEAVQRGIDCILKCQIRVQGAVLGWCQQHDETTLEPRPGRTFELASICPQETTEVVEFLQRLESPKPEILSSIEGAIAWLTSVRITGIRVDKIAGEPVHFDRHDADFDVVVVEDTLAGPIWARHYEIGTNRPVFAGRNAVRTYALENIERERRTGTPWYGTWPLRILGR